MFSELQYSEDYNDTLFWFDDESSYEVLFVIDWDTGMVIDYNSYSDEDMSYTFI